MGKKGRQKTLVIQLAQAQVLGARLIIGASKATSAQVLNVEAHLTPIGLDLDRNQIRQQFAHGPGISTLYLSTANPHI